MMSQILGWGVVLIAIGIVLGLLAITGVVLAAFLPWVAGALLLVGIIMAVAIAAKPDEHRRTKA